MSDYTLRSLTGIKYKYTQWLLTIEFRKLVYIVENGATTSAVVLNHNAICVVFCLNARGPTSSVATGPRAMRPVCTGQIRVRRFNPGIVRSCHSIIMRNSSESSISPRCTPKATNKNYRAAMSLLQSTKFHLIGGCFRELQSKFRFKIVAQMRQSFSEQPRRGLKLPIGTSFSTRRPGLFNKLMEERSNKFDDEVSRSRG